MNVCCDLCYPCAFISLVWSLFTDSRASKRFSALRTDFLSKKRQMYQQRCFGAAGTIIAPCISPLGWLSRYCWLCLRCSFLGSNPMLPKNRTHANRGLRHIFPAVMSLPRPVGGSPRIQSIALDSNSFPESSRHKKIDTTELSFMRREIRTTAPRTRQTNIPLIFFWCHAMV